MDHRLSSEAFNQNYSSQESCVSDGPQQAARVRRQRACEPCPGSQPANPERIYVLRNCDLSPDYMLSPCQENQSSRCCTNCTVPGSCPSQSTNSSGSCPSHSTNSSAEYPCQETLCGEKVKPMKPPKPAPDQKPAINRHTGGNNDICPLCGQLGLLKSDQHMCAQCNERIHTAVNNYLQSQYVAKEQPVNGQWQQSNIPTGDPNLNVIVLQDCQNKQELFDQLAMAMNRISGQVQNPQPSPPGYQNNNYYQNNANNKYQNNNTNNYQNSNTNNYQNSNTNNYQNSNTNNYQNSNANNYQNNNTNNYRNNTPASYNDYDYVDYNRNYEQPEPYDCRCDVSPCQVRPPCCYSEGGYDDYRCSCRTPCSSFDSPPREGQCFCQDESFDDFLDQNSDPGCGCACTCNCEYCRQGFETKEKLAMLIAQALEIFIQGYQEKRDKRDKPGKKKNNKKRNQKERKSAGSSEVPPERPPIWQAKPPKPRRAPESRSTDRSYGPRKRPPHPRPAPQIHVLAAVPEPTMQPKTEKQAPKMSNSKVNAKSNSQVNLQRFGSKEKASREKEVPSEPTNADGSQGSCNSPIFFLPNGGNELLSAHDFGSASWARSCAKCGGGDSRRRRRARRRSRYQNRHHHPEWNQCQREGENRRWQKELGNGNAAAGQNKASGGGKNTAVLLGLSPIAHYRPGMMKFPVNYLLAGTNYRRSLVRTAAGVTLHQKPYMDKDEVKDLPSFPCNKESSHLDCRMPPTKKWL